MFLRPRRRVSCSSGRFQGRPSYFRKRTAEMPCVARSPAMGRSLAVDLAERRDRVRAQAGRR